MCTEYVQYNHFHTLQYTSFPILLPTSNRHTNIGIVSFIEDSFCIGTVLHLSFSNVNAIMENGLGKKGYFPQGRRKANLETEGKLTSVERSPR